MKKLFLIFAILLANSVFISCTDLDENEELEPIKNEILTTDGQDGQDSDPGETANDG
ncbi:hypothetical protein [Polaribacter glomeratus]|uniref:hypothetical protein n=1 Tax=Polaribacter glomeratus TaxID=102 RepID=UPI00147670F2|nr:hypothetical protein [Polaribacter glomeratus]